LASFSYVMEAYRDNILAASSKAHLTSAERN
jgi:hypothetical protein